MSFIRHAVDRDNSTLKITITIEHQQSGLPGRPEVPWKKFATNDARSLLVAEGYNPGKSLEEATAINNAASKVTAAWRFVDLDAVVEPPSPPKKTARKRTTRKKTTS